MKGAFVTEGEKKEKKQVKRRTGQIINREGISAR